MNGEIRNYENVTKDVTIIKMLQRMLKKHISYLYKPL